MDKQLLNATIAESGLKKTYIAERLNLTRQAFSKKLNGENEFKLSELRTLKKVLLLSNERMDKIFFAS